MKPDAKSLGTDSKNTIHSVYATSSKYPVRLEKMQVKNPHQRSPSYAMKLEDRSHEETEGQQRCQKQVTKMVLKITSDHKVLREESDSRNILLALRHGSFAVQARGKRVSARKDLS